MRKSSAAQAKLFRFMGLASIEGHAEGWTITDSEGQEFIDCLGGYGMFALGHRHPKVVEAVEKELHAMPRLRPRKRLMMRRCMLI